jgi:hypothetical protein
VRWTSSYITPPPSADRIHNNSVSMAPKIFL